MWNDRTSAEGLLRVGRREEIVTFCLTSMLTRETGGKGTLRGETAFLRDAFRSGRAVLRLADGGELTIRVVAHGEGDHAAYFEFDKAGEVARRSPLLADLFASAKRQPTIASRRKARPKAPV